MPQVLAQTSPMRTVGVEEELLLVDIRDGRPRSVQGQVLLRAALDGPGVSAHGVAGAVEGEFQQEQLETQTPPVSDMSELEDQVRHWRGKASEAARRADCRIAALASSPLPVGTGPTPTAGERYAWIQQQYQRIARQQLSCGLHVHVAIDSAEEGVGVLDRIRGWLPVLLALSTNSPFAHGEDTGFHSWRSQMMGAWPSGGPTPLFGSLTAYRQLVREMTATGVLLDEGMLYFDARLSHHYPTVEIRTTDACSRLADTVLVAALARAMVETAAREWASGEPAPQTPTHLLTLATFQASRQGMTADLLDPLTSRPLAAWDVLESLLDRLRPALEASGDLTRVTAALDTIRTEGTGSERQRATFERTGQLVDVVAQAVRLTAEQE